MASLFLVLLARHFLKNHFARRLFAKFDIICAFTLGEVAEWSIAAVLKTVDHASGPGVRIPPSPPWFSILETNSHTIQLATL